MKSLTHLESDTVVTTENLGLNQLLSGMPERYRIRLDHLQRLPDSKGAIYEFEYGENERAYFGELDWDSPT